MRPFWINLFRSALGVVLTSLASVSFADNVVTPPLGSGTIQTPQKLVPCANSHFTIFPAFGAAYTPVTISNRCPFASRPATPATCGVYPNPVCNFTVPFGPTVVSVTFGDTPAGWTVQSNGKIVTTAPTPNISGASVPVAVTLSDGTIVGGGNTTFSYPIAEMDMIGPLPQNTSFMIEDPWWNNGANHTLQGGAVSPLTFGIAAPVFHVTVTFTNSGQKEQTPDSGPQVIGNQGSYSATLQVCAVKATAQTALPANPSAAQSCTNWDSNSGYWIDVIQQKALLNDPGLGPEGQPETVWGDIALPAGPAFNPATYDFAHTFRIALRLDEIDTVRGTMASRSDTAMVSPFTAILLPAAMMQLKLLPFTIIFAPPGNQSSVSFQTTAAYNTNYSFSNSTEQSNSSAQDLSGSTEYSAKLSGGTGGAGGSGSEGGSSTASTTSSFDNTTKQAYGTLSGSSSMGSSQQQAVANLTISGNAATIPGNGQTCASPTDCTPPYVAAPNSFVNQPFWNDFFELLVHPQFAVFTLGDPQDRIVYWAADPVLASIQVSQLSACAHNQGKIGKDPCEIQYGYSWLNSSNANAAISATLTLTAEEAHNLLELDPFYVAGSQSAALDSDRAVPFPGPSVSYGMEFVSCPVGQSCTPATSVKYTATLTNTDVTGSGTNGKQTFTSTVTNVLGTSNTIGQTLSLAFQYLTFEGGITVTNGDKSTNETQLQTIFTTSTAVSSSLAAQAMVTLSDCDNTFQGGNCKMAHAPMPQRPVAIINLDKIYGGFMFQDPNAPKPLSPGVREQVINLLSFAELLTIATNGEQSFQRFPDVPFGFPEQGAIGVLARTGIMPGMSDGKFYPLSVLSRAQLATVMAVYMHLSPDASGQTFSDVSLTADYAPIVAATVKAGLVSPPSATRFGPNDAVSRQELATSLATAFALTSRASSKPAKITAPKLADGPMVGSTAADNVQAVIRAGYMNVFADGTFRPSSSVTRAETARALFEAIKDNPR
jgi:hypothetical protein